MGTTEQIHHDIYVTSTVFTQVQNRINKNTAGLGLNLYIIYHIIACICKLFHKSTRDAALSKYIMQIDRTRAKNQSVLSGLSKIIISPLHLSLSSSSKFLYRTSPLHLCWRTGPIPWNVLRPTRTFSHCQCLCCFDMCAVTICYCKFWPFVSSCAGQA